MKFLEKDLEEIIFKSPKKQLQERGLYVTGKLLRQKRIGNYGIADLIEFERPKKHDMIGPCKGAITVYELKQNKITMSAFLQGIGYIKGIKEYLKHRGYDPFNYHFRLVLIGNEIDINSQFAFLPEVISTDTCIDSHIDSESNFSTSFYTYSYNYDGILFDEHDFYFLTNNGF